MSLVSSFSVLMLLGCIMMVCIYYCAESCIDEICFGCGCFDYADVDSALAMMSFDFMDLLQSSM